ncbi:NUDIX hydrolase [Caulobacter zeae]|uniref:GDP-mannose pyrophosphatase n=1 Tax=Caulobacter zeae TaxID=2055137 RepID=A0A2N5CYG2_9CAUL|nr:NUDIX hydrolase [Caulobacter zeae]PLR18835.1 NUDIX hydrolase [Caulobacter zeae]
MDERVVDVKPLYEGWSSMSLVGMRLASGAVVPRHVEHHGLSVGVLPFDPVRRCATLVRMARAPVLLAGLEDVVEVPAGKMEGDDPQDTARQEALEEAGLRLGALDRVAEFWSMPAISSERITLYLAEYRASDRVGVGGGLEEEGEEIEVFEMDLDALWMLVAQGDKVDMKTAVLVYALRQRRPELFS